MQRIPIYAQYYDEKNNLITKEVTYQDSKDDIHRETGINITIEKSGNIIKFKYIPSEIKYAKSQAEKWAKMKNIDVYFTTFTFTTNSKNEWFSIQPKDSGFYAGVYIFETISLYKKLGYGIIIRDIKLNMDIISDKKKTFRIEYIPI
jgi:hypothetical protein